MLATWHFHLEIASKCTLRCPWCARQEVSDGLFNTELDLDNTIFKSGHNVLLHMKSKFTDFPDV